ncbi:unnamed protein product [Lepeophtheirus salmonis]|uniref:(salmon louse) hypothetical protein n=1 Tax=Lepeophtheirus salmonis TaxID=72036 RepID=A0A817FBB8_LEPSM|nr:unnamed protein product [Lepeophtheirus salmonis]CAG9475936.1 unnamed protein product [Lepeophtheirus salmonis]
MRRGKDHAIPDVIITCFCEVVDRRGDRIAETNFGKRLFKKWGHEGILTAFIALSALASADQSSHQTIQHGHAAPVHTSIHKPHGVHHASVVSQPAADPSDVHNHYHADHKAHCCCPCSSSCPSPRSLSSRLSPSSRCVQASSIPPRPCSLSPSYTFEFSIQGGEKRRFSEFHQEETDKDFDNIQNIAVECKIAPIEAINMDHSYAFSFDIVVAKAKNDRL